MGSVNVAPLSSLKCLRRVDRQAATSQPVGSTEHAHGDAATVTSSLGAVFTGVTAAHSPMDQRHHWLFVVNNHEKNTSTAH